MLILLPYTIAAGIALLSLGGCRDMNRSSEMLRWDLVAEGENKELYFIDRKAIARVSDGIVRVNVKYVPSKDQFLLSLQEISKQFVGKGRELTTSTPCRHGSSTVPGVEAGAST